MPRNFGIITSLSGTTVTGCVINSVNSSTSAQKADAQDENGKTTDIWYFTKEKSISVRGVLDATSLQIEAGQTIVFRGGTYGVNSTSVDEQNRAATTFSLDASTADNATIHPISNQTASSGGSGGSGGSGT